MTYKVYGIGGTIGGDMGKLLATFWDRIEAQTYASNKCADERHQQQLHTDRPRDVLFIFFIVTYEDGSLSAWYDSRI